MNGTIRCLMKEIYYNWSPTSYLGYVCRLTQSVYLWGCTYKSGAEGQVPREQGAAGNSVFNTNMKGIHTSNPPQSAMTWYMLFCKGESTDKDKVPSALHVYGLEQPLEKVHWSLLWSQQ